MKTAHCASHFLDYPAWPVVIIVHAVAQTTSRLLHHIVDEEISYTVVKCDLSAHQLVLACEPLSFPYPLRFGVSLAVVLRF